MSNESSLKTDFKSEADDILCDNRSYNHRKFRNFNSITGILL